MKQVKSYFVLLLIFVVIFSLLSTAFSNDTPFITVAFSGFITKSHSFVSSFDIGNTLPQNTTLNQITRNMIFNVIEANPGIHFRGICSILGLSIGVAQYHLGILTKAGLIYSFRDGRFKRFFNSQKFSSWELKIISLLRSKTTGIILTSLLKNRSVSHKNLVKQTEISSQALSWHMKQLKSLDMVDVNNDGIRNQYSLKQEKIETIAKCLQLVS